MTELTQKIVDFDSQIQRGLTEADRVAQNKMKESDTRAQNLIEAQKQLFENTQKDAVSALNQKLKDERNHALRALQQKIIASDKEIDIDVLVEKLLRKAKEQVCL
ncbi:MAG: hypothetical protein DRG24_09910 [Epsilonproteobacteria bacterium]|nr:MAG: hypothetical protein DRG24_09910 [Campylobacterota bacterium]